MAANFEHDSSQLRVKQPVFLQARCQSKLFEFENEKTLKNLRIYATHVFAKCYPSTLCMARSYLVRQYQILYVTRCCRCIVCIQQLMNTITYLSRLIDTVTNSGTYRGALSANLSEPSSVTEMNGVKMPVKKCMRRDPHTFFGFFDFFSMNCIQHCFICRPLESTVSEDAGIEPRTVATSAWAVRRSNHWAKSHPLLLSCRWVRPPSAM
jgi:hypothetical protein